MKKIYLLAWAAIGAAAAGAQQVVPNGGFEDWDSSAVINNERIYTPASWTSFNQQLAEAGDTLRPVHRTTDAHSGSYAVHIQGKGNITGENTGMLASGDGFDPDNGTTFPLTGKVAKIEGWYKYNPVGDDSAMIVVFFYKGGTRIGGALNIFKTPTAAYTKFSTQLQYGAGAPDPDAAKIFISAGAADDPLTTSELYLDDVNFVYLTTGINEAASTVKPLHVYPNPAADKLFVMEHVSATGAMLHITDMQGKTISSSNAFANGIDVSMLRPGMYMISVTDADGVAYQSRFLKH